MKKTSALPNSNADTVGGFPYGSFKDATDSESLDGTPVIASWLNDIQAFFQAMLTVGGVTPNGSNDAPLTSQLFFALLNQSILMNLTIGGTANAITATSLVPRSALVNGMVVFIRPTGTPTVRNPTFQLDGLGSAGNIIKAGSANIEIDDFSLSVGAFLQYFSSSNLWILLNPVNASRTKMSSPAVQTYTADQGLGIATFVFSHGLGIKPKFVQVYAICLIADADYDVGDKILLDKSMSVNSGADYGFTMLLNSDSEVNLVIGADGIAIAHASTHTLTVMTNNSWSIGVDCFA